MSDEKRNQQDGEVKFSFDADDVGQAFGKGMDALKQVMGGFVEMAKEMVGPEMMRNLEASQWLSQVANSLEEAADGLRESGSAPPGKSGEISCFIERLDAETQGSKFESQRESFLSHLDGAHQLVKQLTTAETDVEHAGKIRQLEDAAGYFRAAAATGINK